MSINYLIMMNQLNYHQSACSIIINSLTTRDEIAKFAYSVDLDEVAHNEPPRLDQHCLPSSL